MGKRNKLIFLKKKEEKFDVIGKIKGKKKLIMW